MRSEESQVVFDSAYFKNIDGVEAAIEKNTKLKDIDSRVKEEYLGTVTQYYRVCHYQISFISLSANTFILQCFESIEKYGADLVQLFEDLDSGKFIQQNFDNLLRQEEGKQLCSEVIMKFCCATLGETRLFVRLCICLASSS